MVALIREGRSFEAAWALLSSWPARRPMQSDRGRIVPGLRADIAVVGERTRRIAATLAGGAVSHLAGP
ncbi:MAG: alpha-D-ribose 1-methylphosphonate 5-triphosphate diphosphatase, partial [Roseicyclus sp.]